MVQTKIFTDSELFADKDSELLKNFDPSFYDIVIVCFSGGKDSIASYYHIIELGIPKEKIELHHQLVDGKEGSELMDWPVTEDYCREFAKHENVSIYFSWRVGGFEKEMLRKNEPTEAIMYESPYKGKQSILKRCGGKSDKLGTRLKFPQVSPDLSIRWCSSYLKIDVMAAVLRNDKRFNGKKVLVVTGERGAESSARMKYKIFEKHRADLRNGKKIKRHIDHLRPVIRHSDSQVWEKLKKYQINPHPSYWLGYSRCSCRTCIFIGNNAWKTISKIDPKGIKKHIDYETDFGCTIHREMSIQQRISKGKLYHMNLEYVPIAMSRKYTKPIIAINWKLPPGASNKEISGAF